MACRLSEDVRILPVSEKAKVKDSGSTGQVIEAIEPDSAAQTRLHTSLWRGLLESGPVYSPALCFCAEQFARRVQGFPSCGVIGLHPS